MANETLSFLRHTSLIFKVDLEKAFDVRNFLIDVMEAMGFGYKWRKWMLICLTSSSISVLINGSPTGEFTFGRGVRQGDPFSPFLFIIAAEELNLLTIIVVERNLFNGVEVGDDVLRISHLQFEDDKIFFGEWN
ncbi:uncharacterized mitochondrial protein AtMg01250-like [Rutidosis leptorrhynchoides]|uniref:uncharacterized mitochondrial protein AtMg01250-like n=1 Tax=Rutidosis leptorrhynchoides TaxID=125765 RepID=UPI003A99E419